MVVGFTGSRRGVQDAQRASLIALLQFLSATALHHGDCVGADAVAHDVAIALGMQVIIHPPSNPAMRAYCGRKERDRILTSLLPPRPYIERNQSIVDCSKALIACVYGSEEKNRTSGTWKTVRYAKTQQKHVTLIWPDGRLEHQP